VQTFGANYPILVQHRLYRLGTPDITDPENPGGKAKDIPSGKQAWLAGKFTSICRWFSHSRCVAMGQVTLVPFSWHQLFFLAVVDVFYSKHTGNTRSLTHPHPQNHPDL